MFISWSDKYDLQFAVRELQAEVKQLKITLDEKVIYKEEIPTTSPIFQHYNKILFKDLFKLILENMGLSVIKHPSEYVLEKKEVANG